MTLLDRIQRRHGRFSQQRLELTPSHPGAFLSGGVAAAPAEDGVKPQQVVCFRAIGVPELQTPLWVRLCPLDLFVDDIRRIQKGDAASFVGIALAHLASAIGQAHHPSSLLENQRLRNFENRLVLTAETSIDALLCDVASQFEVLFLVFTNRHQICVVQKDVCRHEHGIVEQADRDVVALLHRLFLELDHALKPVQGRDAIQQPAQFAVGRYLALDEH